MKQNLLFTNRIAVLATMHQKEKAIAPILEAELGIHVTVPKKFNTDSFGTFTRKINRINTQIATARLKAEKALELTGETLVIASEGSFAPHPSTPFLASNREIVIILDKKHNLEIIGEEFSIETNHNNIVVESVEQAFELADKIGFPEHGLVVMFSESRRLPAKNRQTRKVYKLTLSTQWNFFKLGPLSVEPKAVPKDRRSMPP